jgi:ribosomal protein S27E
MIKNVKALHIKSHRNLIHLRLPNIPSWADNWTRWTRLNNGIKCMDCDWEVVQWGDASDASDASQWRLWNLQRRQQQGQQKRRPMKAAQHQSTHRDEPNEAHPAAIDATDATDIKWPALPSSNEASFLTFVSTRCPDCVLRQTSGAVKFWDQFQISLRMHMTKSTERGTFWRHKQFSLARPQPRTVWRRFGWISCVQKESQ